MKRKIVLPLAMAVAIGGASLAMIVPAQAAVTGWVGPFSTRAQCDGYYVPYVTGPTGEPGWDTNFDGVPDADWVNQCGEYSDEYWFAYGNN
jgi:hypothetical protein